MAVYMRLLGELDANNQKISEQISEIDLTDPEDARVLMPEQSTDILAHFGDSLFLERYQRYKAHIAEWLQQYPKLSAVDLRYDRQVILEMAPGTSTVATAAGNSNATNTKEDNTTKDEKPQPAQVGARPDLLANAAAGRPASGSAKAATGDAVNGKTAQTKPIAAAISAKTGTKAGGFSSAKPAPKTTLKTAKRKAAKAKDKKRVTGAKRPALNVNRRNSAPATHPAAVAAEGE
jgi:cell division protein FtsQ